jgi:hypothetical protein
MQNIQKEAVVAYIEVLPIYLTERTDKSHKNYVWTRNAKHV